MIDTTELLIGLIFGSIGVGYCIYGRKQNNKAAFWSGVGLLVLPYIVDSNIWVVVISIVIMFIPRFIK